MVPSRRSSARHFIVSSGTMKITGRKYTLKKTVAGESTCGAVLYCSRMPVNMNPMSARKATPAM